ncbi:MAG: sel1 repeat family protein, partial [Candidatus Hydrogenedentes bacterium]|nr:sel1 repeat family protein [Candidatus Hydrogenedentota bacterium]
MWSYIKNWLTNKTQLISELRIKSEQGDMSALCDLAFRYQTGDGLEKNLEKAASLFRMAAEK